MATRWMAKWLALSLGLCAPALAGQSTDVRIDELMTMRVEGSLVVDTQGQVLSHVIDTPINPLLGEVIDKAVKTWTFEPVLSEGKPAHAKSDMQVTLAGRRVSNGGLAVSVENVLFFERGVPSSIHKHIAPSAMKMPKYPSGYHINGLVTLALRANESGTFGGAHPTQCALYSVRATRAEIMRACAAMENMIAKASREWKFEVNPGDRPASPQALSGTLSVEFVMNPQLTRDGDKPASGAKRRAHPTCRRPGSRTTATPNTSARPTSPATPCCRIDHH